MTRFQAPVPTVCMDGGGSPVLLDRWEARWRGWTLIVPPGATTDGASIPRWLKWFCGSSLQLPRLYAAILHDAAYAGLFAGFSRKDADRMYRDSLIVLWRIPPLVDGRFRLDIGIHAIVHNAVVAVLNGLSVVCAWTEYFALRLFGKSHWTGAAELAD